MRLLRVAWLNRTGVSVDDLSRGSVIVRPNSIPTTQIVDVAYTHLDGATPLETGSRIRLLFGSSEALGKVIVSKIGDISKKATVVSTNQVGFSTPSL